MQEFKNQKEADRAKSDAELATTTYATPKSNGLTSLVSDSPKTVPQ